MKKICMKKGRSNLTEKMLKHDVKVSKKKDINVRDIYN